MRRDSVKGKARVARPKHAPVDQWWDRHQEHNEAPSGRKRRGHIEHTLAARLVRAEPEEPDAVQQVKRPENRGHVDADPHRKLPDRLPIHDDLIKPKVEVAHGAVHVVTCG